MIEFMRVLFWVGMVSVCCNNKFSKIFIVTEWRGYRREILRERESVCVCVLERMREGV